MKRRDDRLLTICLAVLLLVLFPNATFAQIYGFEIVHNTATVRYPSVNLGTSLALNGHSVSPASCVSSPCSLAISTTLGEDVIVVLVEGNSGITSCSISDGLGLVWNTHTACQSVPSGAPVMRTYGVYWAVAISPLTADSVTLKFAGGSNVRLLIFAVNGANTVYPFDPNSNLPSYSSLSTPSGCVMTTSNANDFLFSTAQAGGTPTYTVPGGFTAIDHTSYGEESEDAYSIVTITQSSVTETWNYSPSGNVVTTCDAIVAAGNIGSSTNSLNTAASITISSPITGGPGTSYYENANGVVYSSGKCAVTPDTSTTAPGTSGSFSINSGQFTCLVSPVVASTTNIAAGAWLFDLWASLVPGGWGTTTYGVTLQVETGAGAVVSTVFSGSTNSIPSTSKSEVKTYFTASATQVPLGDYLVLQITASAINNGLTIYWGSGQLTNFQQPNTYGFVLGIINPSSTASWLIDLGYVGSSNGRIGNMTIFLEAPISRQIIIGSLIGSPTPPNTFGPQVTLSPSQTMLIALGVTTTNVGSTVVTITLKIQETMLGSTVTPYAQDTIAITVN